MGSGGSKQEAPLAARLNLALVQKGVRAAFLIDASTPLPEGATVWQEVPQFPGRLLVSLDTQRVLEVLADGDVYALVGYPEGGGKGSALWRVTLHGETVYGPVRGAPDAPPRQAVVFAQAAAQLAPVRLAAQLGD